MAQESNSGNFLYTIACICTAKVGYSIHGDVFWSIVDFFFAPFVWAKWLIYNEVNLIYRV